MLRKSDKEPIVQLKISPSPSLSFFTSDHMGFLTSFLKNFNLSAAQLLPPLFGAISDQTHLQNAPLSIFFHLLILDFLKTHLRASKTQSQRSERSDLISLSSSSDRHDALAVSSYYSNASFHHGDSPIDTLKLKRPTNPKWVLDLP
ncbi:hypothetical protein V6Z11_D08G060700 [Gossypium hirsutum]